jgi:hypothetical protein
MLAAGVTILADGPEETTYIVVCVALITVIIVIGAVVIPWIKRRYYGVGKVSGPEQGFRIEHLERMRREGGISEEEFRRLRRAALGLGDGPAKSGISPSSCPAADDDDGCAEDPDAAGGVDKERE